jgi:hypothetical protein
MSFLYRRTSDRKYRLFACACSRRIWSRLDEFDREFVEAAERVIDGVGTTRDAQAIQEMQDNWHTPQTYAGRALGCLFYGATIRTAVQIQWLLDERWSFNSPPPPESSELAAQIALLRDVIGNPFRPVAFSPEWRTDTAVSLARMMYESRDFSAMPILADALQDTGCDHAGILDHCRDEKATHVRGCWVVDLALGKE